MFPIKILEIELENEEFEELSNAWLLPLMKKYMKNCNFRIFMDNFLPIILKLEE